MAIVNLPHKRVGNDIKLTIQVLDNGVALDWSSVTRIYASLQSDSQHVRMGLCVVEGPDSQDQTKLRLLYPAKSSQYAGVARLVLECNYMGHTSTLDTPAFVFVPSTAEEGTGPVDVEISASVDPETNDLQILVADVDTSVLDDAIQQAYAAADAANQAAENADQSVAHFKGGSTGQVLAKKSGTDYDFEWQDAGGVGAPVWGNITGTLADQTDLKDALAGKQDTISNLATIEAGAAAGATAVQPGALATVATSGSYNDLSGKPTIPAAPGTLQTDLTAAQSTSASEALSGAIKLHKVSKTGDYGDLNNKPTIPAAQVNADWNAGSGVAQILNKPTIPAAPGTLNTDNTGAQSVSSSEALSGTVKLHKISKTGSYADLNNKPTIPSISLNGSTTTTPSFYAPTGAGTLGQVLTSNGSGAPTWQNAPSGGVQDVTVGGTSVVSGGVAAVPAIPSAPGTLDTTATTAQATNASEALSGSVTLHKVSKTGTYSDLIGTPSLATVATSGAYSDLTGKPTIDATPTSASTNAVQSGGVYSELADRYTKAELAAMAETWTFTLDDDSTVTKKIIVLPNS